MSCRTPEASDDLAAKFNSVRQKWMPHATVQRTVGVRLQLPINRDKTRGLCCPQESMKFLGYRIGWNYRNDGSAYIGTRPSKASVQSLCRKVSELTSCKYGLMDSQEMVRRLNWMLSGWSNYFHLGQVSPAYSAIDNHTTKRLRQWFSRKHQVKTGKYVSFSNKRLWNDHGLVCLSPKTKNLPWA